MSKLRGTLVGTRCLGNLTEDRYYLPQIAEEAIRVQQQVVVVLVLFKDPLAESANV